MGENYSFMRIFALLILMFSGNFGFGMGRGPAQDQVTQAELQAGLNNVRTRWRTTTARLRRRFCKISTNVFRLNLWLPASN